MSVRLAAQKTRKAHPGRRYTSSVTNTGMSRMRRVVSQLASPIRSSAADEARFYHFGRQFRETVLGQVASQTRPEGAGNARRTWVYVERCWRPRTKYGEANWPSTSGRLAVGFHGTHEARGQLDLEANAI